MSILKYERVNLMELLKNNIISMNVARVVSASYAEVSTIDS